MSENGGNQRPVTTWGYSERGIINALFYEMSLSGNSLEILKKFLSNIKIPPDHSFEVTNISKAEIIIEHSLSDFGDADAIILIENGQKKQAVFIEAKVKTFQGTWNIERQFVKFVNGLKENDPPKGFTSNLFTQLFFKNKLMNELREFEGELNTFEVGNFPTCLMKKNRGEEERNVKRKIGQNGIVLKLARKLKKVEESFYIALVPGNEEELENFFKKDFPEKISRLLKNYCKDVGLYWGYLSWENVYKVYKFCSEKHLIQTVKAFEWNEGQIY